MTLPIGLRAIHHADCRRFFWAQMVAQTGTWMQTVAQSWLVLQLTPSPVKLGLIGSLQIAPILLFSLASRAPPPPVAQAAPHDRGAGRARLPGAGVGGPGRVGSRRILARRRAGVLLGPRQRARPAGAPVARGRDGRARR